MKRISIDKVPSTTQIATTLAVIIVNAAMLSSGAFAGGTGTEMGCHLNDFNQNTNSCTPQTAPKAYKASDDTKNKISGATHCGKFFGGAIECEVVSIDPSGE